MFDPDGHEPGSWCNTSSCTQGYETQRQEVLALNPIDGCTECTISPNSSDVELLSMSRAKYDKLGEYDRWEIAKTQRDICNSGGLTENPLGTEALYGSLAYNACGFWHSQYTALGGDKCGPDIPFTDKCLSWSLGAHGVWENKYKIAGFAVVGTAVAAATAPVAAACTWGPAVCAGAVGAAADKWGPMLLDLSNGGGGTFSAGTAIGAADDVTQAVGRAGRSATNTGVRSLAGAGDEVAQGGVYALRDPVTGQVVRTGRTNSLLRRQGEHFRDPALSDFEFEVVARTDVYAQQRGLEQLVHDAYSPALNRINPISPTNPNRGGYLDAAEQFLAQYGAG